MDDIAIGGQLLSDNMEKADYHIQIYERNLDETRKRKLVQDLTPAFAELFGLDKQRKEEDMAKSFPYYY